MIKFDVAFIELESNVIERFKQQHSFLNLRDIQTDYFSHPSSQYLLYGYPTTKTKSKKINGEDVIVAKPSIYTAKELLTFRYEKFGFKKPYHIAINFTGEILSNVNKNAHLAPDLGGISGSGLW